MPVSEQEGGSPTSRLSLPILTMATGERQKRPEYWQKQPIVGGVRNRVMEAEQGEDLNSSAAAVWGLLTFWLGSGFRCTI